jgi:Transposase, Mutator family
MPVTNPLERLNAEIKRRTDVRGISPNEAAITRQVGALLLAQNDEWQLQRRYLQLEDRQSTRSALRRGELSTSPDLSGNHDSYTTSRGTICSGRSPRRRTRWGPRHWRVHAWIAIRIKMTTRSGMARYGALGLPASTKTAAMRLACQIACRS